MLSQIRNSTASSQLENGRSPLVHCWIGDFSSRSCYHYSASPSPPSLVAAIHTFLTLLDTNLKSSREEQRWFISSELAPHRSFDPRLDPRFFVELRSFRLATFTILPSTERRESPSSSLVLTAVVGKYALFEERGYFGLHGRIARAIQQCPAAAFASPAV